MLAGAEYSEEDESELLREEEEEAAGPRPTRSRNSPRQATRRYGARLRERPISLCFVASSRRLRGREPRPELCCA